MAEWIPLPQWKEENSLVYQKTQLSTRITKLKRQLYLNPSKELQKEIERLQEERKRLDRK